MGRKHSRRWILGAICAALGFGGVLASAAPLNWQAGEGHRWAQLEVIDRARSGFTLLPPAESGVVFTNRLSERESAANRVLMNGSGVATGDYDNDGWPDIYFCSLNGQNTLYKNLGGWQFKDVTRESGVAVTAGYYRGAVFADINGDHFLDLLVAKLGDGVLCFLNGGRGTFTESTKSAGTGSKFGTATLALADVDGNGTLDLYVANNRTDDIRDRGKVDLQLVRGQVVIPPAFKDRLVYANGQLLEYGEPDVLLLNDGRGQFTPVSWTNGVFLNEAGSKLTNAPLDWGLTATFRDMNGDGAPDLYVCNDFWTPDRIWLNDGKGTFRALDKLALRNMSASSMGVDFADIDRDGDLDFFVVDMLSRDPRLRKRQRPAQRPDPLPVGAIDNRPQIMRNTLFLSRGDGTYAETANFGRVASSEWSWQPIFLDVDLDGFEDLLITTGHSRDVQDEDAEALIRSRQRPGQGSAALKGTRPTLTREEFTEELMQHMRLYPRLDTPIVAMRNVGNGQFEDFTPSWGTHQPGIHHAMAMADFDHDGDLDFVVNNLDGAAGVYRNEVSAPRVAVRLKGLSPNTQGIGAKVKLLDGAVPMQNQEVVSGGRYLSGSDPMLVFAAGNQKKPMTLEVAWRSGKTSVVRDVAANRLYEIDEAGATGAGGASERQGTATRTNASTLFEDVSQRIQHVHHGEPYDDFARQPLLPHKLSQLGPGVVWFDVNADGHADLIVGAGKSGRLGVFLGNGRGAFERLTAAPFDAPVTRDITAIIGWHDADGKPALLIGLANYEDGLVRGASVRQYTATRKEVVDAIPADASSVGTLALGDMNGDGTLEMFVGGRVIPGRYPEAADSRLYRHVQNGWQLDVTNTALLKKAGLVSSAVWSDLTGDGFPELVLACEWGPIRIFLNERGTLNVWNAPVNVASEPTSSSQRSTLNELTGRWNGIATGDIDGDGDLDIVATNWGLNSEDRATPERPLVLAFGELAQAGSLEVIETEYDRVTGELVPRWMLAELTRGLPFLAARFPTHRAYSEASLAEVLRGLEARVQRVHAVTLASMLLVNEGRHFTVRELPMEAQLAPAFGVSMADFDGDGRADIILSQNFFATRAMQPRLDAGRGLLLRGDGRGNFHAVSGSESGLKVYGEQRGTAVADFDEDGRLDIVVSQNGAETKLYRNTGGQAGLRVRLLGPSGNPSAVGAVIRVAAGTNFGPAHEIRAGSGYWSQDSAIQVVKRRSADAALWVRWPGGRVTTTSIPSTASIVTVDSDGKTK